MLLAVYRRPLLVVSPTVFGGGIFYLKKRPINRKFYLAGLYIGINVGSVRPKAETITIITIPGLPHNMCARARACVFMCMRCEQSLFMYAVVSSNSNR